MPRTTPILTGFNGGEWSPVLHGRVDLDDYARACREMLNFLPTAQGAAVRRPGTRYAANTKADGAARLIPFEFSTLQAYVIEAGNLYFRFFRNGAQLESSPGVPVEVVTPYTAADLPLLQWAQSADTLYLAHPSYAPRKLTRTGPTTFSLTTIAFTATPAEWTGTNYPGAVTFWQGRLWWAGTPNQPQTIWGSKSGDFENLTLGTPADSAVKYTLDADQMNAIRWIKAQRVLVAGTAANEFSLSGGGAGDPVTPSNVLAYPQPSGVGSATVAALLVGAAVVLAQRAGRKVHLLSLDEVTQGTTYASSELSLMAGHMLRAGVKEMAWQQEPWRVLWCVLNDGGLVGCTIMRDQQVIAWHRHTLGGAGIVESAAVIPAATYSELWLVVRRTIGGVTRRFVERVAEDFVEGGGVVQSAAYFVDAGLSYSGAAATVFTGLSHLEGQTVQVLADGATHPDVVVTGGQVTLDRAASVVHVGLGYTSRLETLDLNAGAGDGTGLTRRRAIHSVGVILHQTLGGFVGWRDGTRYRLEEMQFRSAAMPMDAPPALFTGAKVIQAPPRWERAAHLVVEQTQPLPITLVALAPRMQAGD